MKTYQTLKTQYDLEVLSEDYIPSGLTNANYHVLTNKGEFVVRMPKPENAGLFDYHHEAHVLALIEPLNLDTPLYAYTPNTGIKISEYVPNIHTYKSDHLADAAVLIKTLHDANLKSGIRFDLINKYDLFQTRNTYQKYNTIAYRYLLEETQAMVSNVRLCHNDLVEGNLLFSKQRHYLIDYEYAMDNDPYFDIMSFLTENDIQDTQSRRIFYEAYFGYQPNDIMMSKLWHFEVSHHLIWCEWAQMMYAQHHDEVYNDIAALKYTRLLECITEHKKNSQ